MLAKVRLLALISLKKFKFEPAGSMLLPGNDKLLRVI
jgi:hypothetical protein